MFLGSLVLAPHPRGCCARCFICLAFGFVFWFDLPVFMPFLGIFFGIEAPGETPATQKKRTSCVNEVQSIFGLFFSIYAEPRQDNQLFHLQDKEVSMGI